MMIKAKHVHYAVNGVLTAHAVATLAAHSVSTELEAVLFALGAVASVWASDVERKIRHPHLTTFKSEGVFA